MIEWLKSVAAENPAKALDICGNLAEYVVPRLSRQEQTGADGGAIKTELSLSDEILGELTGDQLERIRNQAASLTNDDIGTVKGSA